MVNEQETRKSGLSDSSDANECVRQAGGDTTSLLETAEQLAGSGSLERANELADQVIRLDSNNSDAYNIKGFISYTQEHYEEALMLFEKASMLDENNVDISKNLAEVYRHLGRHRDALSVYNHLLKLAPRDTQLQSLWHATMDEINNSKPLQQRMRPDAAPHKDLTSHEIQILFYGAGWPTNIGNAFIGLGGMALLKQAFPRARISFASGMPRWFFEHSARVSGIQSTSGWSIADNALDIASIIKCDLAVFAGMSMCEEFIRVNGPTIRTLARRNIPILLLATGGFGYHQQEVEQFRKFLREIAPVAFISRDSRSYEMFSDVAPINYNGIDCGFYVPEAYEHPEIALPPFIVSTFDSMPEPQIDVNGKLLLHAHHECWGPIRPEFLVNANTLVSDIPHDYLTLYAHADETHTDRVHACVATLAYGGLAKLYHPTPRGSLFESVGAGNIRDQLVRLDMDALAQKKQAQIEFVRQVVTDQVILKPKDKAA